MSERIPETMPARDWSDVPYVRVYYSVITDEKFKRVYDDDPALAAYVRLLIGADQTWPMPAPLPAWLGRRVLKLLAEVELLFQQGTFYRMSGLDKERESRFGHSGQSVHSGRPKYPSDDPVRRRGRRRRNDVAEPFGVGDAEALRSDGGEVAESMRSLARGGARSALGVSSSVVTPEGGPGETDDHDEFPVLAYMASVHATVEPDGNGYHREVVKLVGRKTTALVLDAMQQRYAAGDRSPRQLIYGAANVLEPIGGRENGPKPKGHTRPASEVVDVFNR